jgi:UDP-N-acetylmuramoyl-L-alanyl-D-glutamate--2,6-diaminopimelate ligase
VHADDFDGEILRMSQRPVMRVPVSLRTLLPAASFVGCADIRVTDAVDCSQKCTTQTLFAAIPGSRVDGITFVDDAIQHGANSLLVQRPLPNVQVPQCVVPNVRRAYSELCSALAGHPSRQLNLIAVTGTNGKTTVTWLIRSIFETSGHRAGLLGTIEYHNGVDSAPSEMTTPDSKLLANWLNAMVARDTKYAALEVSSHALDQDRIAGTHFDAAIVTNITQDHFDYHHDAVHYRESKAHMLDYLKPNGLVVLNADDPESAALVDRLGPDARWVTFGLERSAHIWATILEESLRGTRFRLHRGAESIEITTSLVGRHNVSNCLAAAAAMERFDISLDEVKAGIEALRFVPGRLERVECGQPFDVFIDYAHTEDALRRCVGSLKRLGRGRVICTVGAGGDRDRSKRPLIGRATSAADLAIITSDNPRSEDPEQIIREIVSGCGPVDHPPVIEPDRGEAIRRALESAEAGDCVLVAGKGHEREQIIGNRRIPFVDRDVVRAILTERSHHAAAAPCGA